MEFINSIYNRVADQIGQGWTSQNFAILLWIGLAVLTISLLILMRTRWGQVKPLWKCVALSVLAHVLLGGYAYGTRLMMTVPHEPPAETIALNIVDPIEVKSKLPVDEKQPVEQWDRFEQLADPQIVDSEVERVEKPVEFPELAERPSAPTAKLKTSLTPQLPKPTEVEPFRAEVTPSTASADAHSIAGDEIAAATIEPTRRKRSEPTTTIPEIDPDSVERQEVSAALDQLAEKFSQSTRPNNTMEAMNNLETEFQLPEFERPDVTTAELNRSLAHLNAATRRLADKDALTRSDEDLRDSDVTPNESFGQSKTTATVASARRRIADGQPVPEVYSNRTGKQREQIATENGGTLESEQAVANGLKWLANNQSADGRWDASEHAAGKEERVLGHDRNRAGLKSDSGVTGLALLALLAGGNTHLEGDYREQVQRGLEFLISVQASDGNLYGEAQFFAQMYCHSMATLAIAEAYAMTGDNRLKSALEKATGYSIRAQNKLDGGWRYRANDAGDMSQFGWQVMAIKSAELGGIAIPAETKTAMKRFLEACCSGRARGLAAYRPSERPSVTMTAEALACRYFLYDEVAPPTAGEATGYLQQALPGSGEANLYYWYYGTIAMFHHGGSQWEQWNQAMQRELLGRQNQLGELAGSWNPNSVWACYGGRIYSTAMATLSLQVYYRYLPIHRKPETVAGGRSLR